MRTLDTRLKQEGTPPMTSLPLWQGLSWPIPQWVEATFSCVIINVYYMWQWAINNYIAHIMYNILISIIVINTSPLSAVCTCTAVGRLLWFLWGEVACLSIHYFFLQKTLCGTCIHPYSNCVIGIKCPFYAALYSLVSGVCPRWWVIFCGLAWTGWVGKPHCWQPWCLTDRLPWGSTFSYRQEYSHCLQPDWISVLYFCCQTILIQ